MSELRLPSLGADMDAGTIVRWSVSPGDAVRKGDVIGEIETDKGVFDLDSREAGVVAELLVAPGTKVRVGTPIVRFGEAGDVGSTTATPAPVAPAAPPQSAPAPPAPPAVTPTTTERPHASPLARRIAAEHGLELAGVIGTGLHGAITQADVERALAARAGLAPHAGMPADAGPAVEPPAPAAPFAPPADGMRRAIAAAVTRSKREIPHYYLEHDIDLHAALAWLAQHNAERPITERVLPATLLVRATVQALAHVPGFNGTYAGATFTASPAVHAGIVTALRGGGLVAPVIPDAASLPLAALNAALLDLVQRARTGALRTSELGGGTISITNLGDRGVRAVHGVIYPPQVAILGFGAISERPWAVDGMLTVRPVVTITLAADHRVSDGVRGAQLLTDIGRRLQAPEDP
jgi:pyruvate dehydrogenase E2 component (dihydrolipoamide acetyltransferase)